MRSRIREGFLTLAAIFSMFLGGGMASAVENPATIASNPNSPHSITIERDVTGLSNPVTNTFGYSFVALEESNPAAVMNVPSEFYIEFDGVAPEYGTATQYAEFDLGNLEFTEVGDYQFILTEISSTNEQAYPVDTSKNYYVTVSVRNEVLNGVPTGRLLPTLALQVLDNNEGSKMDAIFSSEAVLTYMKIAKVVEGNMARRDEYFKFRVDFIGATNGDVFTVIGQDTEVTYNGEIIATQNRVVVGEENYIYLKHDQAVTIGRVSDMSFEIPVGVSYVVEEEQNNGYVTWVDGEQRNNTDWKYLMAPDASYTDMLRDENQVEFINVKEASVLTGIMMNTWPIVAIIVVGVTGVFVTRKFAKRQ